MNIVVQKDRIDVIVIADTPEVQRIFQMNAEQLRGSLEQQGLSMNSFDVLLRQDPTGDGQGPAGGHAPWRGEKGENEGNTGVDNDSSAPPALPAWYASGPGNSIISVFI